MRLADAIQENGVPRGETTSAIQENGVPGGKNKNASRVLALPVRA
jgi:hypothetical protein